MNIPKEAIAPAVNTFRREMAERGVATSLGPVHESMEVALDASADIIAAHLLRKIAAKVGEIELPSASVRHVLLGFAKGLAP